MTDIMHIRPLTPDLPTLFTHVPKTGGSTISMALLKKLTRSAVAGISTADTETRRAFLEKCKAEGKRYVYGHFRFEDTKGIYDDANFIVALRHPLDRILSFYFQLLRAARTPFAKQCLEDISGEGFAEFHYRLVTRRDQDNLMCRYICGEVDHKRAIETLQTRYRMVWSSGGIDAAWTELYRTLIGTEPKGPAAKRNYAPVAEASQDFASGARPKDYRAFLPANNIELVESANREDVLLYEWFRAQ